METQPWVYSIFVQLNAVAMELPQCVSIVLLICMKLSTIPTKKVLPW